MDDARPPRFVQHRFHLFYSGQWVELIETTTTQQPSRAQEEPTQQHITHEMNTRKHVCGAVQTGHLARASNLFIIFGVALATSGTADKFGMLSAPKPTAQLPDGISRTQRYTVAPPDATQVPLCHAVRNAQHGVAHDIRGLAYEHIKLCPCIPMPMT